MAGGGANYGGAAAARRRVVAQEPALRRAPRRKCLYCERCRRVPRDAAARRRRAGRRRSACAVLAYDALDRAHVIRWDDDGAKRTRITLGCTCGAWVAGIWHITAHTGGGVEPAAHACGLCEEATDGETACCGKPLCAACLANHASGASRHGFSAGCPYCRANRAPALVPTPRAGEVVGAPGVTTPPGARNACAREDRTKVLKPKYGLEHAPIHTRRPAPSRVKSFFSLLHPGLQARSELAPALNR